MNLSPSSVAVFEVKFCVADWTAIGLVVRGGSGSTLDVLKKSSPDIFASIALVEVAGRLVATGSGAVPAETAHCWDHQWQGCRVVMKTYLEIGLVRILQNSKSHSSLLH